MIQINTVQTRCIVKARLRKVHFSGDFLGGFRFCFSQDRLFSRNSTRKPLNLIKPPIFTNAPCKTTSHTLLIEFPGEGVNLRKSAGFLRQICVLGSLCHLSSVPLSAPRASGSYGSHTDLPQAARRTKKKILRVK